jgi:hypothetical protein
MDVGKYLASQASAYWRTSPKMQEAADIYISVMTELRPAIQIVAAGMAMSDMANDLITHWAAITADPDMLHGIDQAAQKYAFDQSVGQQIDAVEDVVKDAADKLLMEGSREQEYLRKQQDAIAQDPEKLEADKQDAAKLEAQWAAQRQADEQDRLARQQGADQKVAERLDEALRKDQEIRPRSDPVIQAEIRPGLEPQDPRLTALDLKHAEDLHKLDDTTRRMEEGLKSRYEGSPDLDGYLKSFGEMAAKQRESRLSEQAAERQQLRQEVYADQQRTVNQQQQYTVPVPPPPSPDRNR